EVSLNVALSSPGGGATLGNPSTAAVIIENDDGTRNPTPIRVADFGQSDPFPSNIHVQGQGTYLTDVDVTLHGVFHTALGDMDVGRVGPSGASVRLLSDVGGWLPAPGSTLTFDDEAVGGVPASSPSGTYRPTDFETVSDLFPTPAPDGPYGSQLSVL